MSRLRKRRTQRWIGTLLALAVVAVALTRTGKVRAQALTDTAQAINKARIVTRIMFVTAHPDDETASLLAYLSRGLYADVALLTLTRGQGGQNAIGPEQDGQLGVVRTLELLRADSYYGVHQYFTRANDPGFSKSADRTMKIWGPTIPLEDMVRAIRTYRPEVVINGWGGTHWGHGQHQASGILTPKAIEQAADPNAFPDQIAGGLKPWKVSLEVRPAGGFGSTTVPAGAVELPVNDVSQIWGESYVQMGMQGHAQHVSQGTPFFFGNPFFRRPVYLEVEYGEQAGGGFDPKLLAQALPSLGERFATLHDVMATHLESTNQDILSAERLALGLDRKGAAQFLASAAMEIEALRSEVTKAGGSESAAAIWELDEVRQRIDAALDQDLALPVDIQADRHELVGGESFSVNVNFLDKPAVPFKWTVDSSSLKAPAGWTATMNATTKAGDSYRFTVNIPPGATPPTSPQDAILPFPPPLVTLAVHAQVDDYNFLIVSPVESAEEKTTGTQTYPLELVPAVTLTVEPTQVMVPVKKAGAPIDLLARVRYHGTKAATVAVGLDAPAGWSVAPIAPLDFSGAGDQLIRYMVKAPAKVREGAYPLRPYGKLGEETFRTSLEPIPTVPTRDWSESADATAHVLDLTVPRNLRVGYIAGDNDLVPESLRRIGIQVDMLDEVALAFGDLSQYDAIVVGIRAYELRPDVARMNGRLLDYVKGGGTLVVEYERDFAWNKLQPAPFDAKEAQQGVRVTDAESPVRFLDPSSPLLNSPNKITLEDFQGWVQERGLYFWSTWSPRYKAVLGLKDANEPEATGGLVYTRDGKGVYIYTGLSFFRELPAGVPGAYRLFVNLLSQTPHAAQSQ
jgi:LmbE family N-acetylglucosaminyl deacetylase